MKKDLAVMWLLFFALLSFQEIFNNGALAQQTPDEFANNHLRKVANKPKKRSKKKLRLDQRNQEKAEEVWSDWWNGTETTLSSNRIGGGTAARPNEYPYFARLIYIGVPWCGGTLIHEDFVLTAAHCKTSNILSQMVVDIGAYRATGIQSVSVTRRTVDAFIVHPDYQETDDENRRDLYDFMVIKLNRRVTGVPTITLNSNNNVPKDRSLVKAIGMGRTSRIYRPPFFLQEVTIPFIEPGRCVRRYGWDADQIDMESQFCAGSPGEYTCVGDSGGPILMRDGRRMIQVGVVSGGFALCRYSRYPPIHARVSAAFDWIQDVIAEENRGIFDSN